MDRASVGPMRPSGKDRARVNLADRDLAILAIVDFSDINLLPMGLVDLTAWWALVNACGLCLLYG